MRGPWRVGDTTLGMRRVARGVGSCTYHACESEAGEREEREPRRHRWIAGCIDNENKLIDLQ